MTYETRKLTYTRTHKDPDTGEVTHSVERATVRLEIDTEALWKELGAKAARSTGGRAREVGGLIVFKRIGKPQRGV